MMLNRIVIMGRLGRDPEVRYTQAGRPVASFSLAVDRDFKDKASGERATDWIPVVAWEARAKFVQQYFHKGQLAVLVCMMMRGTIMAVLAVNMKNRHGAGCRMPCTMMDGANVSCVPMACMALWGACCLILQRRPYYLYLACLPPM